MEILLCLSAFEKRSIPMDEEFALATWQDPSAMYIEAPEATGAPQVLRSPTSHANIPITSFLLAEPGGVGFRVGWGRPVHL